MNKKLHFLLFCFSLIVIIYLCREKLFNLIEPYGGSSSGLSGSIIESFGNQLIIHPDNASFDSQETTFSVLTYDSDLGSGVTQVSTCSDDSSWSNGDKTCRDYSMEGANCEDMGSDGKSAFDACKVACDNCNTYTEVKRRLPSPIEDTDEPSYAQFEGSMSSGDTGLDIGGPDYREIIGKLDDLSGKIDSIEISSSSSENDEGTVDAICVKKATTTVQADVDACAAVTDLSNATACEEVMTAADGEERACTYINTATGGGSGVGDGERTISQTCSSVTIDCSPGNIKSDPEIILATDTDGRVLEGENLRARCCEERQTEEESFPTCGDVTCTGNSKLIDDYQYMSISEITGDDDAKQVRCCKGRTGYCINNNDSKEDFNSECVDGYTPTTDKNKKKYDDAHNNCCEKTGFCGGNVDGAEGGFKGKCKIYEVMDDDAMGKTRKECCKLSVYLIIAWITSILLLIGISVYSFKKGDAWVSLGTITVISCVSLIGFGIYNLVL